MTTRRNCSIRDSRHDSPSVPTRRHLRLLGRRGGTRSHRMGVGNGLRGHRAVRQLHSSGYPDEPSGAGAAILLCGFGVLQLYPSDLLVLHHLSNRAVRGRPDCFDGRRRLARCRKRERRDDAGVHRRILRRRSRERSGRSRRHAGRLPLAPNRAWHQCGHRQR